MSQLRQATLLLAALLSLAAPPARAQLVNDGTTNVLSGVTTNLSGTITIGSNAPGAQLILTNAAVLTNSIDAIVGEATGAISNTVTISGGGTRWIVQSNFYFGSNAGWNSLLISRGGVLQNAQGVVGFAAGSSNNTVVVTDAGSAWVNNRTLYVGYSGGGNLLFITNGAMLRANASYVGRTISSGHNQITVTGSDSVWENSNSIYLGYEGGGNQLVVRDGGKITRGGFSYIGYSSSSSSNTALITGLGSQWSNRFDLYVGREGGNNRMTISNGAKIYSYTGYIGDRPSSDNNFVLVTGASSLWKNVGVVNVGVHGSSNLLVISDGAVVQDVHGYVGSAGSGSNNIAVVTGSGSRWEHGTALTVGSGSTGNLLIISNGALVRSLSGGTIGYSQSGDSNSAVVTGTGSSWTNTVNLHVGFYGSENTLFVTNGGLVQASNIYVGFYPSARDNLLSLGNGTVTASGGLTISSNNGLAGTGIITGTVTNFGTITPGHSAGAITIHGDLRLRDSSSMVLELGGLMPTNQYAVVTVTNFVEFAGTLSLSLLSGFLPEAADSFALMSFASSSGAFANVSGGRVSLTNNLASFAVTLGATNLVLSGVQYVDSDGDGQGDLQEQAAGTDAADPASALAILSVTLNGAGHSVVRFQSVPGQSYRVEYSDNFATWSAATGAVFTNPSPGVSEWVDDGTLTGGLPANARAYRIGLQ